jgi:hypothetical protein
MFIRVHVFEYIRKANYFEDTNKSHRKKDSQFIYVDGENKSQFYEMIKKQTTKKELKVYMNDGKERGKKEASSGSK